MAQNRIVVDDPSLFSRPDWSGRVAVRRAPVRRVTILDPQVQVPRLRPDVIARIQRLSTAVPGMIFGTEDSSNGLDDFKTPPSSSRSSFVSASEDPPALARLIRRYQDWEASATPDEEDFNIPLAIYQVGEKLAQMQKEFEQFFVGNPIKVGAGSASLGGRVPGKFYSSPIWLNYPDCRECPLDATVARGLGMIADDEVVTDYCPGESCAWCAAKRQNMLTEELEQAIGDRLLMGGSTPTLLREFKGLSDVASGKIQVQAPGDANYVPPGRIGPEPLSYIWGPGTYADRRAGLYDTGFNSANRLRAAAEEMPKVFGFTLPFRLRPRGRQTKALEETLIAEARRFGTVHVGEVDKPSFRAVQWFRGIYGDKVKVLACDRVTWGEGEGASTDHICSVLPHLQGHELNVSLRLLAKLTVYQAFRPRHQGSLLSLRAKAAQYSKEIGLPNEQLALVIHGTVALALLVSRSEKRALKVLGYRQGEKMAAFSKSLKNGEYRVRKGWFDGLSDELVNITSRARRLVPFSYAGVTLSKDGG